jgi:hypothetical protein
MPSDPDLFKVLIEVHLPKGRILRKGQLVPGSTVRNLLLERYGCVKPITVLTNRL